jgi:hypothetical protein
VDVLVDESAPGVVVDVLVDESAPGVVVEVLVDESAPGVVVDVLDVELSSSWPVVERIRILISPSSISTVSLWRRPSDRKLTSSSRPSATSTRTCQPGSAVADARWSPVAVRETVAVPISAIGIATCPPTSNDKVLVASTIVGVVAACGLSFVAVTAKAEAAATRNTTAMVAAVIPLRSFRKIFMV